jgi:hypothetical protein
VASGKKIGGCVYIHRDYVDHVVSDIEWQTAQVPDDWDYVIVKINLATLQCSFIKCADFDTAHEPTVGDSFVVKPDGTTRVVKAPKDPWIYHHKWMMVDTCYGGFDYHESQERSRQWEALASLDKSRIGKKSYWQEKVGKILGL